MLESSKEIHRFYLEEARNFCKGNDKVLKTDLDNEAYDTFSGGIANNLNNCDVYAVEVSEKVFNDADKSKIKAIIGDIRKLPYPDQTFNVVLDFSTLDHIPPEEVECVLQGYNRVLKEKGRLLLVVWCGDNEESGEWKSTNQYYFNAYILIESLGRFFDMTEIRIIYAYDNKYLYEFKGIKK